MMLPAQRYAKATGGVDERMVSCSDDRTLCLWLPCSSKKHVARMTGQMQPVKHVAFSPDGSMIVTIASASFDNSNRRWQGWQVSGWQTRRRQSAMQGNPELLE